MFKTIRILPLLATLAIGALAPACVTDGAEQIGNSTDNISGRPYFELLRGETGKFHFNFAAANHEIVLTSQSYTSRTGALGGVLSVLDNAGNRGNFEARTAKSGESYFVLHAANGKIIGTSEMYASSENARRGILAVMNASDDYLAFLATRRGERFVVYQGANGYYFNLRAGNGEIMLRSEAYTSEAAAFNGTFSVWDNGTNPDNFRVQLAKNGGYYLNLVATNGQIIATSEIYDSKSNAKRALESIVELLPQVELL